MPYLRKNEATIFQIFIDQFKDLLVFILIAAAIISMLSDNVESALVILAVITLNAILGTVQTVKAKKFTTKLKGTINPTCESYSSGGETRDSID